MTKPTFPEVSAGDNAWDAQLESWRTVLNDEGLPLASYANIAAWDAVKAQRDETIAQVVVNDDVDYTGPMMLYGDAGATKKLAWQATEVAELGTSPTITVPADTPATADALRDDLVANALAEIQTTQDGLYAKVDAILAAMKNTGGMASA